MSILIFHSVTIFIVAWSILKDEPIFQEGKEAGQKEESTSPVCLLSWFKRQPEASQAMLTVLNWQVNSDWIKPLGTRRPHCSTAVCPVSSGQLGVSRNVIGSVFQLFCQLLPPYLKHTGRKTGGNTTWQCEAGCFLRYRLNLLDYITFC